MRGRYGTESGKGAGKLGVRRKRRVIASGFAKVREQRRRRRGAGAVIPRDKGSV